MGPQGDPIQQDQVYESCFHGPDGEISYWNRAGTFGVVSPDGSTVERRLTDYLLTVDGFPWDPSMLRGPTPIYLVSCNRCRQPSLFETSNHGLCTLNNAQRCVACQGIYCPRHSTPCSDGQTRCVSCVRTHRIKNLFLPLFFESK